MRLLAVTHEASRTGSVVAFVQALEAMTERGVEVTAVVKARGPMVEEIADRSARVLGALSGIVPRVERYVARRTLRRVHSDAVYASTVLSSEYAAAAVEQGIPVVLHVHEQEPLVSWAFDRARLPASGVAVVCPSEFIRDELQHHGVRMRGVLPGPVSAPSTFTAQARPWRAGSYRLVACGSTQRPGPVQVREAGAELASGGLG
jgi:hypothetical protein